MMSGRAVQAGPQQQARPLRSNTRQRLGTVPGSPFAWPSSNFGGTISILLPQVGLLSGISIWCDAQINDTASETLTAQPLAPFNLLKRVQLVTNLGTASIIDLSGYGASVVTTAQARNANLVVPLAAYGGNAAPTNDPIFQYPLGFTANQPKSVRFGLYLPVAANFGRNFGMGLINLQAPELRVNLNLTVGALSDLYSGNTGTVTIVGGGVYVSYWYYEIPPPSRNVAMPPLIVHRLLEDSTPFSTTGDVNIGPSAQLQRQGKLLRMFHTFLANGQIMSGTGPAGAAGNASVVGLDRYRIVYNYTDTVYDFNPPIHARIHNRAIFGRDELPPGTFGLELWAGDTEPARGDFRDVIDTEAISTIQAIATINPSVTLGVGNNRIDTIREIVQGFSVAAAGG